MKDGKIDYSRDFFGKSTFLTVSGQLEAETYATALGRVYTFGYLPSEPRTATRVATWPSSG